MRYVSHWPSLTPLLFLAVYLPTGTPRAGGFRKLSAYTRKKVPGMRSGTCMDAPPTAAGSSFSSLRGRASAVLRRRYKPSPLVLRVNSYTGHGSSTSVTDTRGVSGGQLTSAA